MREEYVDHVAEYRDNLMPLIDQLQEQGKWRQLSKDIIQNYAYGKSGILFQFMVN